MQSHCVTSLDSTSCSVDLNVDFTGVNFDGCTVSWETWKMPSPPPSKIYEVTPYPFKIAYIEYRPYIYGESIAPKGMFVGKFFEELFFFSCINTCTIDMIIKQIEVKTKLHAIFIK